MRRGVVLGTIVGAGMVSIAVTAYQAPAQGPSPLAIEATRIEKVRGNLYMVTGSTPMPRETFSGGNTGVFVTGNGVIIVDTKLAGWGQVILDRIRTVTDKPVTMIINTHTHGDHTGSNPMFPPTVDIVAHENTKTNMTKMDAFKGDNARFLPKRTFTDKLTIGSGEDRVELYYFGRGHTNGDTWIVFPSVRVMQTGDMFAWKDAPGIDRSSGGSGLDYAATVGRALATVHDVDALIVGHSPLRTLPELEEYQQFMTDFVNAVKAAQQAGKSVEEATASIDLGAKYKDYTKERYQAAVQAIYDELKSQTP